MGGPPLAVDRLAKTYRGNWLLTSTRALDDVSFEVREGERVGILGHNGAGKTTTFKAAAGLIRPTSGNVSLFGRPPREREARARLGYLPESPTFHDFLTGEEVVDLAARLVGVPSADRRARVAAVLDRVGIGAARGRRLRTYSKGMAQRVGVAQAIVGRPALAVLDEPMTGLDPVGRREVRDLIASLPQEGATVVFSTHVLQDVELTCDRVVMFVRGRVAREGSLADLLAGHSSSTELTVRGLARERVEAVAGAAGATLAGASPLGLVVRAPGGPEAAEALRVALVAAGGGVVAVVPRVARLEDVYLEEFGAAPRDAA